MAKPAHVTSASAQITTHLRRGVPLAFVLLAALVVSFFLRDNLPLPFDLRFGAQPLTRCCAPGGIDSATRRAMSVYCELTRVVK